jgi:acetolactate synthase-1/3 small subunit
VIEATEEMAISVTKQIEKQIGILKAFYHTIDEIVYQEIALYKVPTEAFANGDEVENLIRNHNARILTIEPDYIIVEKTGHKDETRDLFRALEPYGILQFARSGRIALTKQIKEISTYLKEIELHHLETADDVVTY